MAGEMVKKEVDTGEAVCMAMGAMALQIAKGGDEYQLITSWVRNEKGGLERLERHECDVEENGVAMVNIPVKIAHFSLKPHILPDNDGTLKTLPALTLETVDGLLFTLFSATALKTFTARLRTHLATGQLSEKRPLALKLVQREGGENRKYYWFERV